MNTYSEHIVSQNIEQLIALLKIASNPVRLSILRSLYEKGEMTVSELIDLSGVEQSLISHHLNAMKKAGLVSSIRNGRNIIYHANLSKCKCLFEIINSL
jgi:DNA-binding transcriptional ArsR family regulator